MVKHGGTKSNVVCCVMYSVVLVWMNLHSTLLYCLPCWRHQFANLVQASFDLKLTRQKDIPGLAIRTWTVFILSFVRAGATKLFTCNNQPVKLSARIRSSTEQDCIKHANYDTKRQILKASKSSMVKYSAWTQVRHQKSPTTLRNSSLTI